MGDGMFGLGLVGLLVVEINSGFGVRSGVRRVRLLDLVFCFEFLGWFIFWCLFFRLFLLRLDRLFIG